MKSVVIEQPGELVLAERPLPTPAAGEVRVNVHLTCFARFVEMATLHI